MTENLAQNEIAAFQDATFGEAWYGDFIEVEPGLYKAIICVTWHSREGRWSVTTDDGIEHNNPETFRYKINPHKPEGPAFV